MKYPALKSFTLMLLISTSTFLTAAEPVAEPLKVSTDDVLKFLGAHAWKWTYRASAPYTEMTVRLVLNTRMPSGKFERNVLRGESHALRKPHTSDDILVVFGRKDRNVTFVVSFAGLTFRLDQKESILPTDYGIVGGGVPETMGSEYLLLTRYKMQMLKKTANSTSYVETEDLDFYVSVEVETK